MEEITRIINPKTDKEIIVGGRVYMKLLREGYTEKQLLGKKCIRKNRSPYDRFKEVTRIVNPYTGKQIIVGGRVYMNLLKEGYTEKQLLGKTCVGKTRSPYDRFKYKKYTTI